MSCVMPCGVTCMGYVVTFALVSLSFVFFDVSSRLVPVLFTTKKRGLTFTSARVLVRAKSGKVKKYGQFGTWSKSFSQSRNFPARLGGAEVQDHFWAPRSLGDEACSSARVKHSSKSYELCICSKKHNCYPNCLGIPKLDFFKNST